VFSLAFALAGEWTTAYTIAAGAYGIARAKRKHEPRGPSTVKGDEATSALFSVDYVLRGKMM